MNNENEIIININEANKAKRYDNKGLFQKEAFDRVKQILDKHDYDEESNNIVDCRFHDTIFIDGGRGVGKTAFMLNIKNYYEDENRNSKKKYLFLDPVDPTLLEHTEKFLGVILARIVEKVNESEKEISDTYYNSLEKLSKSLKSIKTLDDDLGIEEIASNKSSLKLEQHAHIFFKEVKKLFKVDGLIMLIDDIDMAFDKGFDVLEVVRKYLASPFLIPIVAGDMKLYKEIVETHFMDKIKFSEDMKHLKAIYSSNKELKESFEYEHKKKLLNNLVEQYLHKIFPNEYHIQLKNIFTILKEKELYINFDNNLQLSFKDIKDFEIRHINWGINQKEFTQKIFTDNTRDFVQYIYNKREIFYKCFKDYKKDKYKEKDNKKTFIISNRLDPLIEEKIINNSELHKESLKLTADFYRYSNEIDKKRLSLLLDNDVNSFTDNGYSIYKALKGDFFINQKYPYNKINKEIVRDKLYLPKNRYENIDSKDSIEYLILFLMIYNNYYSNNTTKFLIISGKFIETIICIIDQTLNNKEKIEKINDLNLNTPFLSGIKKNRYLDKIKNDEVETTLKLHDDNYTSLVESFQNFDKTKLTSIFLYEMLNKYTNNINILKAGSYSKDLDLIDKEVNSIILNYPIFDMVKRISYIFLNSVASFESSKNISIENIAIDGNVDNIKTHSRAFINNINNIDDGSLTQYLYQYFDKFIFSKNDENKNSIFNKVLEKINIIEILKEKYNFNPRNANHITKTNVMLDIIDDLKNDGLDKELKYEISQDKEFKEKFINWRSKAKGFNKDKYQETVDTLVELLNA